ncbi:hypothetical protein [Portibacter lacus]|nr:hypothetical protein [Portibacter lacus]
MMKFKLIAFLFTIVIFFSSCYKDEFKFTADETPEVVDPGDISNFFAQVPNKFDSLVFKAEDGIIIVTENQTIIEVSPGSLLDQSGNFVTGDVDFKYIEVLNPAEYAFYGLPTISNKQLLRTDGVFRFEARQEGKELSFKGGRGVRVRLPDDNPEEGMQLFRGEGSGDDFNWSPISDATGSPNNTDIILNEWFLNIDSTGQDFLQGFGYEFTCELFTWINVDIFVDIPEDERTTVCVELPEMFTNKNTTIFMLFKESKSILGLNGDAEKMQWCEPYGATPKGFEVTFIVISHQGDDKYYFALKDATIVEDHLEYIEPEETTIDEIVKEIENL